MPHCTARIVASWLAVILLAVTGTPRAAATGVVTNCFGDDLIKAISTGGDVSIACSGVFVLSQTIVIATNTTLSAADRATITSTAGTNAVRLFTVKPGITFTVKNVALLNGAVAGEAGQEGQSGAMAGGAAIFNDGGNVTLQDAAISGHSVSGGNGGAGASPGGQGGGGGNGLGGAIYNNSGAAFWASNVTFTANSATGGGGGNGGSGGSGRNGGDGGAGGNAAGAAIYNAPKAMLTLLDCTFGTNHVHGADGSVGGAASGAFSFAGAPGSGGDGAGAAICNDGGIVSISNSTFAGNTANGGGGASGPNGFNFESKGSAGSPGGSAVGGGVFNQSGTVGITNCTFAANSLSGGKGGDGGAGNAGGFGGDGGGGGNGGAASGGGVANGGSGTASIVHGTFVKNTLTSGSGGNGGEAGTRIARAGALGSVGTAVGTSLLNQGGSLLVKNSILGGSRSEQNSVAGTVADGGFNIVSDATLQATGNSTLLNSDALVGELGLNGGLTATIPLLAGSPAVNAIPDGTGSADSDQRHAPRVGLADIGAFEAGSAAFARALSILKDPGGVTISWPANGDGFILEATDTLSVTWTAIPNAPNLTTGTNTVTLPVGDARRFFRLKK
jgi:hypothetical protein